MVFFQDWIPNFKHVLRRSKTFAMRKTKPSATFTPILNLDPEWVKPVTRQSVREMRKRNCNAYFYKPKRKLQFDNGDFYSRFGSLE